MFLLKIYKETHVIFVTIIIFLIIACAISIYTKTVFIKTCTILEWSSFHEQESTANYHSHLTAASADGTKYKN